MVLPGIQDPGLKIGVPLYTTLLFTMAWRAAARMSQGKVEILTAIGAITFVISDGLIGLYTYSTL